MVDRNCPAFDDFEIGVFHVPLEEGVYQSFKTIDDFAQIFRCRRS